MAAMNTADIGFEKEIWKAADKMRGNIDASEYKSVVLGLIFLKYISDKFEAKYQQLVAEGEGFEEDKDEYLSNKNEKGSYDPVFYVPAEARWEAIAIHAHSPEIGTIIDNAMRAIEKENKRLKDILPKNFAVPSSTNAAWVKLSICLQIFGCMSTAIRRIFWVVLTNIVFRSLLRPKENWQVNFILRLVSLRRW